MRMSLQNRGTAPHHFPSLASRVTRSTQRTQTPLWSGPILCLRQGPLASCLTRAIHIEDEVVVPLPVEQPTRRLFLHQRTSQEIFEEQGAQGLHGGLIQRGEKTRERRTGW